MKISIFLLLLAGIGLVPGLGAATADVIPACWVKQ
jgi:hypothetical protein